MDSDGDKQNKISQREKKSIDVIQRYITNVGNVLSPIWLRRPVQVNNGFEWFILDSRYSFLLYFRLFLVILYISYEIFK